MKLVICLFLTLSAFLMKNVTEISNVLYYHRRRAKSVLSATVQSKDQILVFCECVCVCVRI